MANTTTHSHPTSTLPLRFVNTTGVQIPARSLISFEGYDTQRNSPLAVLAQANGAQRRADLWVPTAVPNGGIGTGFRHWIEEGTAAAPLNTSAATVDGQRVYLSGTVAGAWTLTGPGASEDYQEVGSIQTRSATIGRIMFNLMAGGVLGFGPDTISSTLLTEKMHRDIGQAGFGWVSITGSGTADGDRIVINSRVYEFDSDAMLNVGADVQVDTSGGANAAQSIAALVAAINADASRVVNAIDAGGNVCMLVARVTGAGGNYTLTNPIDGGGTINVSGATLTSGQAPVTQMRLSRTHAIVAAEVTELARSLGTSEVPLATFPSTATPVLRSALATRVGAVLDLTDGIFTLRQANANWWALCYAEPAGGALLAAADVVAFDIAVAG